MCEEIGLEESIDELLGKHANMTVSTGNAVVAMVLNMLFITTRPLYLTSEFLKQKPVDRLISPELTFADFSDDVLGRSLDRLYASGLETIFINIAKIGRAHV